MDQAICTTDFKFSSDVLQLIDYYEEECDNTNCPKKIERISDTKIGLAKELIKIYDENETDYNFNIRNSKRKTDYKLVCKALNKGKIPEEMKTQINPIKYNKHKRCNIKRIVRLIHLLKVASYMGKRAFENFVVIPDINYVLNIIEKDEFQDLKYLTNEVA